MFSKTRLSIDIRGHIIKVVEGRLLDDNNIKVEKSAYLDMSMGAFKEDKLLLCQENVDIIKNFLKKHRFSASKVFLNISDNKVITRVVKLPKISLDDLKSLINMEVPKYLPVDLNRFFVDFRILGTINEEGKMYYKILLCAIPREIVKEYVDMVLACGLEPLLVDIHANSISRIYQSLEYEDVAIIDGGAGAADLMVLDKGQFYLYTTFPFDIPNYIELLRNSQAYDVSVLENQMQNLIKEVSNYINFYLSRNEGKKIEKIYVTGDIALIEGVENIIKNAINVEVIKGFDRLISIKKPKKNDWFNENFYSGNIGILLRGV